MPGPVILKSEYTTQTTSPGAPLWPTSIQTLSKKNAGVAGVGVIPPAGFGERATIFRVGQHEAPLQDARVAASDL